VPTLSSCLLNRIQLRQVANRLVNRLSTADNHSTNHVMQAAVEKFVRNRDFRVRRARGLALTESGHIIEPSWRLGAFERGKSLHCTEDHATIYTVPLDTGKGAHGSWFQKLLLLIMTRCVCAIPIPRRCMPWETTAACFLLITVIIMWPLVCRLANISWGHAPPRPKPVLGPYDIMRTTLGQVKQKSGAQNLRPRSSSVVKADFESD